MTRKLNQNQIDVLLLLYKFRYATSNLLTQKLELQHRNSINSRLRILQEQEYIGRKYDKSYKMMNKPASYFMLPKGLAALRGMDGISNNVLKNMYKDAGATNEFVERNLAIFGICNKLEDIFGQRFDMFSKSELTDMEGMPEALPDGLVRLKTSDRPRAKERFFFLHYEEERQPLFAVSNIITKHRDTNDKRKIIYKLTPAGLSALPILYEVGTWGLRNSPNPKAADAWLKAIELDRDIVLAAWRHALQSGSSFFMGDESVVKKLGL